jgi:hypothetical protein
MIIISELNYNLLNKICFLRKTFIKFILNVYQNNIYYPKILTS